MLNLKGEVIGIAATGAAVISHAVPSDEFNALLSGPELPLDKWQKEKSVRAYDSLLLGEWSEGNKAIEHYNEAIKLYPNFARAYLSRGIAKFQLGELLVANQEDIERAEKCYIAAINDFSEVIKRSAANPDTYRNRGAANFQLGKLLIENQEEIKKAKKDYIAAINDFNEAIGRDPNYAEAYLYRGAARQKIKQQKEAKIDFQTADRLNPDLRK